MRIDKALEHVACTGIDAAMTEVILKSEENAERAGERRREALEAHDEAQRRRIDAMRDAIDERFVGSLLGALDSVGGAASQLSEALDGGWATPSLRGGGSVARSVGTFFERESGQSDVKAEEHAQLASQFSRQAEALGEDEDRAMRRGEHMVERLESIARARMDARLAAARG